MYKINLKFNTVLEIFLILISSANCFPEGSITKVILSDGLPKLTINGKITPLTGLFVYNVGTVGNKRFKHFVAYESPRWLAFMKGFVDQVNEGGMTYLGFGFPLERALTKSDALFDYAATKNVYLLPMLNTSHPPMEWRSGNLVSLQKTNTGEVTNTVSFHIEDYWKIIDPLIKNFIEHYKNHPALLGRDIRVGVTGENNYGPTYLKDIFKEETAWCGYSEFALKRFRTWLKERYKDESNLRQAWQNFTVTFEAAQIPQPLYFNNMEIQDLIEEANGPVEKRRNFYDWQFFRLEEKNAERNHFAKLVKGIDPNHLIVSDPAFKPFDGAGRTRNGTIDGWEMYLSPYIDVIVMHPRLAHIDESGRFNRDR